MKLNSENMTSNKNNIISSIKKEKLQSELVVCIERLPIVVKAENDVTVGSLSDYSSEEEDEEYVIEESQNEVNFSLKRLAKPKPTATDSEEEESPSAFKDSKCNEKAIKKECFIESKVIVQEELDIKDEDEADQSTAKSSMGQSKKQRRPSKKTATLDRIRTSNRRFRLTDPPTLKCFDCTYQTHRKSHIVHHVRIHMEKNLKRSHCSYETRDKWRFRPHQQIHVPKKRAKLHQCPECSFTSIWKGSLTKHMLNHKNPDEAIWYQCPECPYKTKHQSTLKYQHMLIHKKDQPMHKCTLCLYKTPYKRSLTNHIEIIHRLKGIQSIHCREEGCSFKTHHESNLARHIKMIHECKRFFKCSECSFETKYSKSLKAHKLGHDDQNKWFPCTLCPHKTTHMTYLKQHMLVHKSSSETKWFHCSECPFKSKYNHSLTMHKLKHNLNPEKVFICSECSYKTVLAHSLRTHQLVHKKPEEISKWFYCYLCTVRTTRKGNLSHHIQKMHRDSNGWLNDKANMK